MSNQAQKAKIHIAKKELNLSEENYRAILSGFGAESSTDLNFQQAEELIKIFKEMGWKPKPKKRKQPAARVDKGWGKEKYEYLEPRPGYMAAPVQLRLAEVLWRIVARNPSDAALEKFVHRQTKIKKLEWLKKKHVCAVLCALQDMYTKAGSAQISQRVSLLSKPQRDLLKSNINEIIHMG
ncbi:MAG: regulatory protein GemA [Balneolales bacterium]